MDYLQVSDSSLSTFESCERKFEMRKLYPRRTPVGEDFFAARVGQALHAGVQGYMSHGDVDRATFELLLEYPYELLYAQTNDYRDVNATLATFEAIIDSSVLDDYELAMITKPDGSVVPAVEVPFAIRMNGIELPDGRGIEYIGYIDGILRHKTKGTFHSMDIKTHRRFNADADANYRFAAQQIPYGLVVDHIAGQTQARYEIIYLDCYVDLLEPRVSTYEYSKGREDVDDWLLGFALKAQRIQRAMELDFFQRTGSGCVAWNRPCPYLDICGSRDREEILSWFLCGDEPAAQRPNETPWVTAEIDLFGKRR